MSDPRPRAPRAPKPPAFHPNDLAELLYAFGSNPYPGGSALNAPLATLATLNDILTDFVVSTTLAAARTAAYSRRQKVKADDFKWALRGDGRLLGRALEHLWREKSLKDERKVVDVEKIGQGDGLVQAMGGLEGIAAVGEVDAEEMRGGQGKRRRKRKREGEGEGGGKRRAG